MNKDTNKITVCSITIFVLLLANSLTMAQITDQTIRFTTSKIDLLFQPPLRSGFNSEHPLEIELPQLNLAVNLMENYLNYLNKLQKIATGTRLNLFYAPGMSTDSFDENPNLIKITDTGMNQLLQKVNLYLGEKSSTEQNYLFENADLLLTIPDNFSRPHCDIISKLELFNISSFIDSLEPDTELAVANSNLIFTTRPHKNSNRIFMFSELNNVCSASIILNPSRKWYANLTPTNNGRFLAFTEDNEPMVVKIGQKAATRLFPDRKTLMMAMNWSPTKPILAGMILDLETQQRIFFAYDAKNGQMLSFSGIEEVGQNYLYAHPYWAPNGNRLILTNGRSMNLFDIDARRIYKNIHSLPNEISELIWSQDSKSFAVVEIIGQVRSKTIFDDFDLHSSILHRYRLSDDGKVTEDYAQTIRSRNTIKLVSFWTQDRILYLEGHLISKKLNTPFWDLSKSFSAFLTPPPSQSIAKEDATKIKKIAPIKLPMKYLYVFRNLDGKFVNVYDAGYAHTNHLFCKDFHNLWFIGLRKPESLEIANHTFNLRFSPYPFPEENYFIFSEVSAAKTEKLVKFLQDYNLRVAKLSPDNKKLFFLANFCGPLNVWEGNLSKMAEGLSHTHGQPQY